MPQSQAAPDNWFETTRTIRYASAFLPIAKRVGFFLGGSPALELVSSSFCFVEKKWGNRVRGAGKLWQALRIEIKLL